MTLVTDTYSELGLSAPNAVVSSTAQDVVQMLALFNAAGRQLMVEHEWQKLVVQYRFTSQYVNLTGNTVDGSPIVTGLLDTTGLDTNYMVIGAPVNQDTFIFSVDSPTQVTLSQNCTATQTGELNFCQVQYAMPADYERITNRTQWDKSNHWEMLGPEDAQQWQWLKSGYISTGPRIRFRIIDNYFTIWPPTASNLYLGFEYRSSYWVRAADGTPKPRFTADTDTCIYNNDLIINFAKLKFWQVKGFDTTAYTMDYRTALALAIADDTGAPTLNRAPKPSEVLINWDNIPDSGYGS